MSPRLSPGGAPLFREAKEQLLVRAVGWWFMVHEFIIFALDAEMHKKGFH